MNSAVSIFQQHKTQPVYDRKDIILPKEKISFDEQTLQRFLATNVACLNDDAVFYEYLVSKGVDVYKHIHAKELYIEKHYPNYVVDKVKPNTIPCNLWKWFVDSKEGMEILEPFLSEFKNRLVDAVYYQNYILEDESKLVTEQRRVVLYRKLKIERDDQGYLSFSYLMNDAWKPLPKLQHHRMNHIGRSVKSTKFFEKASYYNIGDGLYERLSKFVIADMFNYPAYAHSQNNSFRSAFEQTLEQLYILFRDLHDVSWIYLKKSKDNLLHINNHGLANSMRKVDWVCASMISPLVNQYYKYFPQMQKVDLDDHNEYLSVIKNSLEHIKAWEQDNIRKLCLISYTYRDEEFAKAVSNPNILSYDNIILKDTIRNHPTRLVFADKRSYQHFISKVPISVFKFLLTNFVYNNSSGYPSINANQFLLWTYYLAYSKHKNPNTYVLFSLFQEFAYMIDRCWISDLSADSKELKKALNAFVYAVDALYPLMLQTWKATKRQKFYYRSYRNATTMECLDFLRNTVQLENGKQSPRNLLSATKHITTESLIRHAEQWHTKIAEQKFGDQVESYTHLKEFSHVVGKTTFTLITDNKELYMEGNRMHHCVYSFNYQIRTGSYLVFKVENDQEQATLGVDIRNSETMFKINQCYSYCNAEIQSATEEDVFKFIEYLNSQSHQWLEINKPAPDVETVQGTVVWDDQEDLPF